MNKVIVVFIWLALPSLLLAQKENYNWVLGGNLAPDTVCATVIINFDQAPFSQDCIYKKVGIEFTNSSLSDSLGRLLCFSNGTHIFNAAFDIMENGGEVYPSEYYPSGFLGVQSAMILPVSNTQSLFISGKVKFYYAPSGLLTGGFTPVFYYKVNFSNDQPLGKVEERDIPILNDTVNYHGISAVRHANGRDWWLVLQKNDSNLYYNILIRNGVPEIYSTQNLGPAFPPGLDHTVFSPDGNWYIRYSWWGTTSNPHSSIYLYHFDRCSGALSNFQQYELKDDGPGGVAVSPNSRYLYVSNWDTIFQYDLQARDIFATETVVAAYDGFRGEDGYPVRFFTPQLAPDGRIYLCVPNVSSRYLHYIEYPDSAGMACKVVQHGLQLPVYNSYALPNLPYFRLYAAQGSPCDTVWRGQPEDFAGIMMQPNPGDDLVTLHLPGDGLPQAGWLRLYSATGALVLQMEIPLKTQDLPIPTAALAKGLYFYEIRLQGKQIQRGKWIKG